MPSDKSLHIVVVSTGCGRRVRVLHLRIGAVVCAENAPGPARGHAKERYGAQGPAAGPGTGPAAGVGAQQGPHGPASGVLLRGARVQRLVHVRAVRQVHCECG